MEKVGEMWVGAIVGMVEGCAKVAGTKPTMTASWPMAAEVIGVGEMKSSASWMAKGAEEGEES